MKSILFLGNSFTFFNDLPAMLHSLAPEDCHIDSILRGGAFLHQFLDPADELHDKLKEKIRTNTFSTVILQDQSANPALHPDDTIKAAVKIAALFPKDTKFLLYQTWSYRDNSEKLHSVKLSYPQMRTALRDGYANAAKAIGGTIVPVGDAFALATQVGVDVYKPDDFHPSAAGTYLAACLFCHTIFGKYPQNKPEELDNVTAQILRSCVMGI